LSGIKKSLFFKGYLTPTHISFVLKKISDDKWLFIYTEKLEKPEDMDEEEFEKTLSITTKVANMLPENILVERHGNCLVAKSIVTLNDLINSVVAELISFSNIGDITLRDLLISTLLLKSLQKRKPLPSIQPTIPQIHHLKNDSGDVD